MNCDACGGAVENGVCRECGKRFSAPKKEKKPVFKKWWFWAVIVLAVLLIGSLAGRKGKNADVSTAQPGASRTGETGAADAADESKAPEAKQEAYEVGEGQIRTWTDSIGSVWVSVAVPVKNTGSVDLYLSSGAIDVEDASGALVKTLSMVSVYPQILRPGETAYYYEETSLDAALPEGCRAVPHTDVEKAKVECVRYETSEVSVKDTEYSGAKTVGRVLNSTDEAESMVYIVANLFDADGNLLAQQIDILDNELKPGEKIGFEASNMGYEFAAADVASYEVYAFPIRYQF